MRQENEIGGMTAPTEAGAGVVAKRMKPTPITKETRWQDAKGRTWRVFEHLHFGRYFCVLADRPSYSGQWTAKEIREALATGAQP